MFFTVTDRVLTIPRNMRYAVGCQSGTGYAGQENIRGASTELQRAHKNRTKENKKIQHLHKTYVVSVTIFTGRPDPKGVFLRWVHQGRIILE